MLQRESSTPSPSEKRQVQSYWLSLMASVVRLTSAPKHNRSECRVRTPVTGRVHQKFYGCDISYYMLLWWKTIMLWWKTIILWWIININNSG